MAAPLFQPGERPVGRAKGTPNKHTRNVRMAIESAAYRIGGVNRLVEWIRECPENERIFWSQMYMRLLPYLVQGTGPQGEIELRLKVKREDMSRALESRGMAPVVFGQVTPKLIENQPVDAEPDTIDTLESDKPSKPNGSGNGSG